jgi:hypothetical protein
MITTNSTAQQADSNIVKVDPLLIRTRRLRKLMIVATIIMVVGVLLIAASYLVTRLSGGSIVIQPLMIVTYVLIGISMSFSVINMLRMERFWKRLEQRRQAAARGEQSLLAAEQPVPNASSLQLPLTIGQRPNWFGLLFLPAIMIITMLIIVVAFLVFLPQLSVVPHHRPIPPTVMYVVLAAPIVVILVLCGVLFGRFYYKARQQLTVTETGLIKPGFRKVQSISWKEARLFAINGIYGAKKYQYPSVYELSSANEIIRWTWMRPNSARVLFFAKPTVPKEEYNRQMQALLSLIAGRTGLPLYDLRESKIRK